MADHLLEINTSGTNNILIINGETSLLLKNPSIRMYLLKTLGGNLNDDSSISINYSEIGKEELFKKIQLVFERLKISIQYTEEASKYLEDLIKEEENFKKFSKDAEKIIQNKYNKEHFSKFEQVLRKSLKKRKLYPLQLLSAYHLAFSQHACNFSVPGAGKTSVVYGAFAYLNSLPEDDPKHVDRLLIIGPLSSFSPWEMEYRECFGEKASAIRLNSGMDRRKRIDYLIGSKHKKITLISYDGVPSMNDALKSFLGRKGNNVMVVLDEAHKIKNTQGGVRASAALALSKYCRSRVILTGTPIPNSLIDLTNLFRFIWPNKNIINFNNHHLSEMSEDLSDPRIKELIKNISPYFIRVKKKDLNLPRPIENPPVLVDMGPIQSKIYRHIETRSMPKIAQRIESQNSVDDLIVKARLIGLRQAATNPAMIQKRIDRYLEEMGISNFNLIDNKEISDLIKNYESKETPQKYIEAGKLVKSIVSKNEKVIVWANFIYNIKSFEKYLKKIGINSKSIHGAVPIESDSTRNIKDLETRERIINEFHKENSSFSVLIANPETMSESVSLHKACHNAIYLEKSYNAAHLIQSKDRIHRVGLKMSDKINYHYMLSKNTIDKKVHEVLIFKEERMRKIIDENPIPLFDKNLSGELTRTDIQKIIEDYATRNN